MARAASTAAGANWLVEVHDMMYGWDAAGLGGWWMLAGMGILALAVVGSVWLIVHRPGSGGIAVIEPPLLVRSYTPAVETGQGLVPYSPVNAARRR